MLFLNATCTQHIQNLFEKMIGMLITYYDLPLAVQSSTRQVTTYAHYYERPLLNMFKYIKNTLVESSPIPKKSIVYSNILRRVMNLQSKIGNYLDDDDDINQHGVIVVHGKFSKVEKGRYTQLFLDP